MKPTWNHGGYCESRFELSWERGRIGSEVVLHAVSERICHMPLDQEEIATGQSDIAMTECRQVRYGLAEGKLTKLSEVYTELPCQAR